MKNELKLAAVAVCLAAAACTQQSQAPTAEPPVAAAMPTPAPITAQAVLDAFKSAGLPLQDVDVYTAENDPNSLLGRPGQYTGKANWNDSRHPPEKIEGFDDEDEGGNNTVEVFPDEAGMAKRRAYVESVTGNAPMFLQYVYGHRNALVRLDKKITPDQAAEYQRALEAL